MYKQGLGVLKLLGQESSKGHEEGVFGNCQPVGNCQPELLFTNLWNEGELQVMGECGCPAGTSDVCKSAGVFKEEGKSRTKGLLRRVALPCRV